MVPGIQVVCLYTAAGVNSDSVFVLIMILVGIYSSIGKIISQSDAHLSDRISKATSG
jgi:hypothetical protein